MQGAVITTQDSKLYLETYLIDTSITKKNKKVSEQTIDDNVQKSRGHSLTLFPKAIDNKTWIWDHPVLETNSLDENIELQKKYTIGHEISLKKVKDGYWNAVYEITDEGAKQLLKQYEGKTIPFYTSTGIIHNSTENPLDIKDWRIIHNAIVSEPANGFEKAAVVNMCAGTEQSCQAILTASLTHNDFNFCVTTALANYISSLSSSSSTFPYYTMSSESSPTAQVSQGEKSGANINYNPGFTPTNAQTGQGSIPILPDSPPAQFAQHDETKKTEGESTDYKALSEQLKSELKQLKTEKDQKETENKTVTDRLANLERENSRNSRKNQVFAILQQYPEAFVDIKTGNVNQQDYSKTVLEWIDKGFDDKTIGELLEAKVIKVKSVLQAKNEHLKQVYSSVTTPDDNTNPGYQTTQMTTASVSDSDSSLPIWERVFDLTNARIKNSAEKYQKMGGNGTW